MMSCLHSVKCILINVLHKLLIIYCSTTGNFLYCFIFASSRTLHHYFFEIEKFCIFMTMWCSLQVFFDLQNPWNAQFAKKLAAQKLPGTCIWYFLYFILNLDYYVLLGAEEGLFSLQANTQQDPVMEQVA